jgi:mycothiol synthase
MKKSFAIRRYAPETDLSNLARMLTEVESIDQDGEDTSEEYLRASLTWPNYRPASDVWVAEEEGKLVGYAAALEQPSKRCTVYAVVHPSQRRQGLGRQLFQLTLDRARELGSNNVLVYANENNIASNLFLKNQGGDAVGSSGAMRADDSLEMSSFEFPKGFLLKRYSEVNDPLILLSALNDCYLDMWGHQYNDNPSEEEKLSPRFLNYYDADDILLLFDPQNSVCAICSLKSEGKRDSTDNQTDLLDAPGVIKEYREQGYQRQLVLAGVEHLRKKAKRPITLEFWGDNQTALDIYRSLGFEMTNHYIAYHKELN